MSDIIMTVYICLLVFITASLLIHASMHPLKGGDEHDQLSDSDAVSGSGDW